MQGWACLPACHVACRSHLDSGTAETERPPPGQYMQAAPCAQPRSCTQHPYSITLLPEGEGGAPVMTVVRACAHEVGDGGAAGMARPLWL